ncbi:hypothetical protein B5F94_10265 [Flavonifractor sp. An4]|nr:hypothetical protein B5F94_10265 [Flavonifractor sp. An4]
MISNEERRFLFWLNKQPEPISKGTMAKLSAPEYSSSRIDSLYERDYLLRTLSVENNEVAGLYAISDKARAVLQEGNRIAREKAVEWIRYIITTAIAVLALIRTFL